MPPFCVCASCDRETRSGRNYRTLASYKEAGTTAFAAGAPQESRLDMGQSFHNLEREESGAGPQSVDFAAGAAFWQAALFHAPWGLAILDAAHGTALWLNEALRLMLQEGAGLYNLEGQSPLRFLPTMKREDWQTALRRLAEGKADLPRRLQFPHESTRNITYWEWSLQPTGDRRYALLMVQSVTENVLSERMLSSAWRAADQARLRAEALARMNQMVSASSTIADLLQAIVQETAATFESAHAAVLLWEGDSFRIGHSIGLADAEANADFLQNPGETLAMRALIERQPLGISDAKGTALRLPLLANGEHPASLIVGPIQQGETWRGAVAVYFESPRAAAPEELSLLAAFASQVGIALQKADLFEQIAAQRRQLQSIFDNAPVSIVLFDTDFRVVAINQAAMGHYWGEKPGSPIGEDYREVFHDVPPDLFPSVRRGQTFHASHYLYRLANGRDGICDVSLLPLRDETRQVVGLLLLSFEVTELVQARQEAENALTEVRAAQTQMVQMEKMRAIGELASGVAHDLNNALMAVLGYTELAEESLDDAGALQSSLNVIKKAASDASSTVRRLQNFARQRTTARGEPTDVNQVAQDVIQMTRPRWRDEAQKQGRHYAIETHFSEVPTLFAEASGLREVLINILHNAMDAMPQGGTLTLATRVADGADGKEIQVEVGDTGKGMTPEVAARIFDPFFTTRGIEGTGLGLAVSWTIIQRHGGRISVDSAPGQGTRFTLHLPVTALRPEDREQGTESREQEKGSGARILVVDDEPVVASILTSILTRRGYAVTAVNGAKEALRLLREPGADFQLLLTDHGMPEMTGLELIAEARRDGPKIPIIMLTGWGQSLLQNHSPEEAPDDLLGKPINQADLLDSVAKALKNEA